MSRFLQRLPSLLARTRSFLHSPVNIRHSRVVVVVPLFDRAISRPVFFSSDSDSAPSFNTDKVLSKEELKNRIQKILDDGDEDSIPDLFELMMIRKLSGNHDDSDDEVMEEVVRKYPVNDAHDTHSESDIESDDDLRDGDDSSDSDIESDDDDLRDGGDSSDSDIEFDGLRDVDLSNVNIKIDGLKDVGLSDDVNIKIDDGRKANHSSSYSDSLKVT
ncbi:PREDICTED: coiled-coil domain-containing protein 1-like [Camelina sativa]|uniref:Coiled-coil domain-containing protein 1-like n=1 Tax=Camelina sativa TaxID=90675 RepID=A0ABM0WI84_CAMSA|nr:PREDICTED: coiled-coil domain-containing protein 1-like [Camelina sativa]